MQNSRPAPRSLSRRSFLLGSAATAGAAALAGCTSSSVSLGSAGPRIRQWNLFGGGDGARLVAMHEEYAKQHPNVDFEATTWAWGAPFYTKVAMASAGGRAPDVATAHLSRVKGFSPGKLLDPFPEDLLAEAGITKDKFLPATWDRCIIDGRLYAVPLDTHPFVMYYNTEVCEKAGLLDGDGRIKPFQGEDGLVETLGAVKEVTGKLGASFETTNPWRLWWTLYRQQDGGFFDESGTTLALDEDKGVKALALMKKLADQGLVSATSDYAATVANFSNGTAGMSFNGEWEVTTYEASKMPFSMAAFPNVLGSTACAGDAHTFVLPHQRTRSAQNDRATISYISWMLENSADWAAGGHVPSFQPVAKSSAYLELKPQSEYRAAGDDVQFDPDAWFSGSGAQMQNEAGAAFAGVCNGSMAPEQALSQFKSAVEKLLATPSPVVV